MNSRRLPILAGIAALLGVVAVLVYWPRDAQAKIFGQPLSAEELLRQPDEVLLDRLAVECARRMALAPASAPQPWRTLPDRLRPLWMVGEMEERLLRAGLLVTAAEAATGGLPGLDELATAYRFLGLPVPAAELEAASRRLSALQPALNACRDGGSAHGVRALADADQRFRKSCGEGGTGSWRIALVRRDASAILGE